MNDRAVYPFVAIVGQEEMKLALRELSLQEDIEVK